MRNRQAGTSVLAALVFVAIFVLFISGYKIASQSAGSQAAAVAATSNALPEHCAPGELYTVNMSSGSGSVQSLRCFVPDPKNPSAMIPGPDAGHSECAQGAQGACAVRYCPPSSYVTESGTCFVMAACEPGSDCLRSSIQNAKQPVQAANIIAAQLLADKGETHVHVTGVSGPLALADKLSDSGRTAVTAIINETADAAAANNLDSDAIRDVARGVEQAGDPRHASGPAAHISCQPKIAEPGMKVAVAFGCTNSTVSSSNEFSTGGRLWGATEVRLEAGLPNGVMSYGLSCSDGTRTSNATCDVAVQKPFMLLSADGAIAWITRGMDVCNLSVAGNPELSASFDNPLTQSGVMQLPAVLKNADIVLTCTTVGGDVRELHAAVR